MCVYNDGAWEGKRKPKVVKLKRPRRGRPRKDEVWPPPNPRTVTLKPWQSIARLKKGSGHFCNCK